MFQCVTFMQQLFLGTRQEQKVNICGAKGEQIVNIQWVRTKGVAGGMGGALVILYYT